MTEEFIFENDHAQYMSLGSPEKAIPLSLELRAKACLKELADIHREYRRVASELKDIEEEFELFSSQWERDNKEREDKFEDAMSHFQNTKDKWERVVDAEGNVHWIDTSYLTMKPMEHWPFGDTSWTV